MGGQTTKTATVMTCVRNGVSTSPSGYAVGGPGEGSSYNNSIYMTYPSFGLPAGAVIDSATMHYDMTDWDWQAAVAISLKCAVGAGTPSDQVATQGTADVTNVPASTLTDTYNATHTAREMLATGDLYLKMYAPNGDNRKNYSSTKAVLTINYTAPPAAPTIGTAARVSDTQATIGWTNNPTSTAPYASLNILRSTDGGTYTQIASGVSATATSYTDTTVTANHSYTYKVQAVNAAGTGTSGASNTIAMTPAAPSGVVATKTGASAVDVTWTDNSNTESNFRVRRRVDAGSWSTIDTVGAGVVTYTDSSVPGGTVEYGVQAYTGSLDSAWSPNSNSVTTTTPPAAPTLTSAWGAYSPTGTTIRVSWQHNTLDGSAQEAADIVYTKDGVETTYNLTGAAAYYDIPITGLAATKIVTVKVRTKGLHVSFGAYSGLASTTMADNPQTAITTPAADGTVVTDAPLVAAWSYTDEFSQAGWTLQLFQAGLLQTTWTGTTETSKSIPIADLADDTAYSLTLTVRSGSGFTATVSRTFSTDYTAPTVPLVTAAYNADMLSCDISAEAGALGALPATDHLALLRIDSYRGATETAVLADPLTPGSTITDYVPRLDQDVTYRVLAVASNGAYSITDAVVATDSSGACAVNFGDGYAQILRLQWDAKVGRDLEDDSEAHTFAGREEPVAYAGEHTRKTLSVAATVVDDINGAALEALGEWRRTCTYRQPGGYRAHAKVMKINDSVGDKPGATAASVGLLVVE